jgi:NDP-sugar pyrophosphorylase family protein
MLHVCTSACREFSLQVSSCYIRGYSTLINSAVTNSSVVSTKSAPSVISGHSSVSHCIVHRGCVISNASAVLFSALQPGSGAIRHAVVSTSIVASGTVIAEAEVSHALVGPFVGLHHHSLLIAAMWPQGKGNIAYGANVGSNHTGKLPDQESCREKVCSLVLAYLSSFHQILRSRPIA